MTRILVVNHGYSAVCGIHDLGTRIRDRLAESTRLEVSYAECCMVDDWRAALDIHDPQVVVANYRVDLTPWVRQSLPDHSRTVVAILHNYEANTLVDRSDELLAVGFERVWVLDPSLALSGGEIFSTPRPLPSRCASFSMSDIPSIGSFGFAFAHKRFELAAAEVNETFDRAVFHLHAPDAHFGGGEGPAIRQACQAAITKPRIELVHTTDHVSSAEAVTRLGTNHVNCLLYAPGQPDAGRSSALDYLIAARRPILVSDAFMFTHAYPHVAVWPDTRLRDVFEQQDRWQAEIESLCDAQVTGFLEAAEAAFT